MSSFFASLVLCSSLIAAGLSVPQEEFLPYGSGYGDSPLPSGPDGHSSVDIPAGFVYYGQVYMQVHISVNGLLSFKKPIINYSPATFPLDDPQIAPFLADADTSGIGTVWYRITEEKEIILTVAERVQEHFEDDIFLPKQVIIVTWDHVGYFPAKFDKVNTFQCVLATDGSSSYVMFLYLDNGINWYKANDRDGVPAQVGFNKGCGELSELSEELDGESGSSGSGDTPQEKYGSGYVLCGVYEVIDLSSTDGVVEVEEYSNIDGGGLSGFYMWRVSSSKLVSGSSCNNKGINKLLINPKHGHQFGGTPIIIAGLCYKSTDKVRCLFGSSTMVDGVVLDSDEALCVSPVMSETGPIKLRLILNNVTIATTVFSVVPYYESADVQRSVNNLVLRGGDTVTLTWNSTQLLPMAPSNDLTVKIMMYQLPDPHEDSPTYWSLAINGTLLSSTDNSGSATVELPPNSILPLSDPLEQSPYTLTLFKLVFVPSASSTNKYISGLSDLYLSGGGGHTPSSLWSHLMFLQEREDSNYCTRWSSEGDEGGGAFSPYPSGSCVNCVPSCPCNTQQASLPNSGFLSIDAPGLTTLNRFLHPESSSCFTSIETRPSLGASYDASQICCYNSEGGLIVGVAGGGHQAAVSPLSLITQWSHHFLYDVSPYIACCLPLSLDCLTFYSERPSDNCRHFSPWRPGWLFGDPHLLTLDGLQYTFNGRGEFTLIDTVDNSFILQGRMVPATTGQTVQPSRGTVFSAIVASDGSDTVELRATSVGMATLINGVHVELSTGLSHRFNSLTLFVEDSHRTGVLSASGINIQVTQQFGHIGAISVSISDRHTHNTRGLLGSYNDDPTDDLMPKTGSSSLPVNSTQEQVHYQFGLSWIISDPADSLFTYDQSDSFQTYHHPDYVPLFEVSFTDLQLQQSAESKCEGDQLCLFDIAASGSVEVGVATLEQGKSVKSITETSQPVHCDSLCVEGACTSTNSCLCSYGFEGDQCDMQVYQTCEDGSNLCLNGATCTLHLFVHHCSCLTGFTGQFCETADCGELVSNSPLLSLSYNSTLNGSVATFSCPKGYDLVGDEHIFCWDNGSWSLHRPHCVVFDCGAPPSDSNHLNVSYVSTVYGSVAVYSCGSRGYSLTGNEERTCGENGQWSGQQPECRIDCGVPPTWGSGVIVRFNVTVEGSTARYECEDGGQKLFGSETVTCLSSGAWSEEIIECRDPGLDVQQYIIIGSSIGGCILLFILVIIVITSSGMVLNRLKATLDGKKGELELTEI